VRIGFVEEDIWASAGEGNMRLEKIAYRDAL
jgi:hypothetical protein